MLNNIPDFKNEIVQSSTYVITEPVINTENELYDVASKAISNSKIDNVIWICYNKAPGDVVAHLLDCGATAEIVNKIHFIDILSNMLGLEQKRENTLYCSSPTEYNFILRSIDQLKKEEGTNLVVLDNMNALQSYDMIERIIRFIRNLNNLVLNYHDSILYLGISGGCSHEVEVSINATMDHVYYLQGNGHTPQPKSWEVLKSTSWNDVITLNAPLLFGLLIVTMTLCIFMLIILFFVLL
ncbi:MAG: hypothetical protein Q7J10_02120 [Methanosarcinaceae archaeon]|nr:hypothetical protein [Methanosarcinaceae archaeon]